MKHYCKNAAQPNEAFLLRSEAKLKARVRRVFRAQMNYLLEAVKRLPYATNAVEDDIDGILSDLPGQVELSESIIAVQKSTMDKGGKYIAKELDLGDFGIVWSLTNQAALKFLGSKLNYELSNFRGNITGTTKTQISKIILDAVLSGQSYNQTAQTIMDQGKAGVFSAKRAELIAVREARSAYEQGKAIPVTDLQNKFPDVVVQKYWQTVNDNRVTVPHAQNQADGWIAQAQAFSGTGDQIAPGSDNPRCRCVTSYRLQ